MRILDLYCGAGGAAAGYALAWPEADITGVDIRPQPEYPFHGLVGDVLELAVAWVATFDFIHASPPCQAHTTMSAKHRNKNTLADERVSLIAPTRRLLQAAGKPYVIENVPGARSHLRNPVVLSGDRFGLQVVRPRLFETSFRIDPDLRPPRASIGNPIGVYGPEAAGQVLWTRVDGSVQRRARSLLQAQEAMGGMYWMSWRPLCESVPMAYTEWIARQYELSRA